MVRVISGLLQVTVLICAGCTNQTLTIAQTTLGEADKAYAKLDLDRSSRILERLPQDPDASPEDKVGAEQRLAKQDWKFHKNLGGARARLVRADARAVNRFDTWMVLSRIEREAGNLDASREAAEEALQYATSRSQTKDAWVQLANIAFRQSMIARKGAGNYGRQELSESLSRLSEILDEEPGHREASTLLLGLALLADDGPSAHRAWRSYYRVPEGQSARGLMEEPSQTLDRLLPGWKGRRLTRREKEKLVLALAQSRLFEYAALVAGKPYSEDSALLADVPRIAEIVAYSEFLDKVEELTNEFYRLTALGKENRAAYKKEWDEAARKLWEELYFEGKRPSCTGQLFEEELGRRFGAYINFGNVGGYFGLAMGHRVIDEAMTVRQYGHEADLRFVALDSMVSNFYTSWFWDGNSAVGGWAKPSTIYQVRAAYADGPILAWRKVSDPELRREVDEKAVKDEARDDALAAGNPYAYLPGLKHRLHTRCLDRLRQSVMAKGYEDAQLCLAFVAEYERMEMESGIFAHEGRHAIDEVLHPIGFKLLWNQAEREFRAKLSEIAFATDPQLAFCSAVLNENIGGDTSHGQANERVVKGIVEWMSTHQDEIPGLDPQRPLLPQFDLLTFEQIRAAVRKMDPLAAGNRAGCVRDAPSLADARQAGPAEGNSLGDEGLQGLQRSLRPEPDPEYATTLACGAERAGCHCS